MHFFIGLTFHPHFLQFKKIDSFRKRFDFKYGKSSILQMTLLPPFRLEGSPRMGIEEVIEHIEDELEGHLLGLDDLHSVDFNGFDFKTGRTGVIFLKPTLPIDLFHCQENLLETLKHSGAAFKKQKSPMPTGSDDLQTFLPIGRFWNHDSMAVAIEKAKVEFSAPFRLPMKDVILFQKVPGQWLAKKKLFTFSQAFDNLSQEHYNFTDIGF